MSRLQLQLPTIQNWNCHNCGGCCKQHGIFITDEERRRIESQHWEETQDLPAGINPIVTDSSLWGKKQHRLAQQSDGSCVFLDERGLCRIHGKFGEEAKPLACRIYPYAFHPHGDEVAVSLRFSCPSVTQNLGTPIPRQKQEIRKIAELVVPAGHRRSQPPIISGKNRLNWDETLSIVQSLDGSMGEEETPVALKLLRSLFWLNLIGQTNFQNIRGERIDELLEILTEAAPAEIAELPEPEQPVNVAMMQFRLLAGQYARKDTFASMDTSLQGRWKQFKAATQLSSGKGLTPIMQEELGAVPFEELEHSCGALTAESEELFTRYYRIKIQGMHFCGPAFYDISVVEGFQALALVYPVTLWLARWRAVTHQRKTILADDIREALQIVDHQHGYSPVLGSWGARKRVQTLASSGNLNRLIVWYNR